MFWAWDVTVTAGASEASPKTQILKVSKGVIVAAPIMFPKGCRGLVKARLFYHEFQLVPLSRDEWVTGNGETVPTEEWYEMKEGPYELKFVGICPDAKYDHVVTVRVTVLPLAVAAPYLLLQELLKVFQRLMGA